MPLTQTIVEKISDVLVTRLTTLTTANTEQTTVSEVIESARLGTFTPRDLQIIVQQGNPELVPELMCSGNPPAEAWSQTFNLYLHMMPSETDTESIDTKRNRFIADVRKVVCNPASTWHTFGGFAITAEWQQLENIEAGESCGGILMPLAVIYRTDEGNPYNFRA
jgi:hypothetical protein